MLEVAAQIIICLIVAALLGGVIGYLLGRASCTKDSSCQEEQTSTHELHIDQNGISIAEAPSTRKTRRDSKAPTEPKELGSQPILLTSPRGGKKDNLQLIKGIGNVLEGVLNEIGIYHFEQIANLSPEEVKWLNNSMAFPGRIEREEWVIQAKTLASGIETEFAQRVEKGEVTTSKKSK